MMSEKDEHVYRLWWEYLRRSKNYKEFCDWMKAKREDRTLPPPDKFNPKEGGELIHVFFTYRRFGDIHSVSFKQWWKWYRGKVESNNYEVNIDVGAQVFSEPIRTLKFPDTGKNRLPTKAEVIVNDITNAEYYFDRCIESYENLNGKKPTLQEFKRYFSLWCNESSWGKRNLFLVVDVSSSKSKEIAEKIILQKRKTWSADSLLRWRQPSSYVRIDELKRYLNVYDLRECKVSWKDVIGKLKPKVDANDANVKRAFQMDCEKAKKIIKFAEFGFFPGPYDKTREMRMKGVSAEKE